MKMLAVSILVIAMMVLTQANSTQKADSASPTVAEKEESTAASNPDSDDEEPGSESEEDEDESDSPAEENAESGNETQAKHEVAKRSLGCRCGWTRYGRRCFRYFPAAKTWALAQRHCQAYGGNLASVHNRNEDYLIRRLARNRIAWIGLSDAQQERYWFWIDGTRVNYAAWSRGQPDNHGRKQHCARINWGGAKRWDDWYCVYRHGYVCAKRV
ncbi:galactose-specific lectin nattectin-like isoform X2 [Chelmon rostratus]|uniref:galactose-specific lectin nattectin-like isoform X2 n=1 Tax=Chelmon rostratus TaxID=109905 RepID=UPI001BED35BD|nr:galactose-specific lectin nattectin-like isoform X2 [Chelmon rostratus]